MSENEQNNDKQLASTGHGISLTPALTALFKPTFDLVGLEIRDYVKETIDGWKEKRRRKNLETHISAVNEELKGEKPFNGNEPSINQLTVFEEWVEGIQEIDPADEELSSIWRNLLIRAAKGEHITEEILRVVKLLSPKEAQFLIELEKHVPVFPLGSSIVKSKDRYLANQLLSKGLAEKDYAFPVFFIVTLVVSGVVAFSIIGDTWNGINIQLIFSAFAIIVVAMGFTLRSGIARWRLSWLGQELLRMVNAGKKFSDKSAQQDAPADAEKRRG